MAQARDGIEPMESDSVNVANWLDPGWVGLVGFCSAAEEWNGSEDGDERLILEAWSETSAAAYTTLDRETASVKNVQHWA